MSAIITSLDLDLIPFNEAKRIMRAATSPLSTELVSLSNVLGRVAAEDVIANEDMAPYPRSAMDGYALRSIDSAGAMTARPVGLPVTTKVFAGDALTMRLAAGTAVGITTGAPLPQDADAVIPWEQVRVESGIVFFEAPVPAGNCVFPPADDVRRGEILLRKGSVLGPGMIALLAFIGRSNLRVYRPPRVHLLCTGNELVDASDMPGRGQVRNSNAFALMALLSQCGADPRYCGTVDDRSDRLREALIAAVKSADLLITTGGASQGERDLVKRELESLGANLKFRRVALRPGKPFAFAQWGDLPICVLPGNPSAAFVCFHEFVRPFVLGMVGRETTELPRVMATLTGHAKSKHGLCSIVFATLSTFDGTFRVRPLQNQCSALVRNPAMANSLIVLPEGPAKYEVGDEVPVQVMDWESVTSPS